MIKKLFLFCLFAQLGGFDVLMAPSDDSIEDACRKKLAQAGYGAIALEKRNWGGDLNFGLFEFTQAGEPYVLKVESQYENEWSKVGFACVKKAGLQDKIMVPERVLELGVEVNVKVYEEEEERTVQSPAVALIMRKAPGKPFLTLQGSLEASIPGWKEQCRACGEFLGEIFQTRQLKTGDINVGMFLLDAENKVISVDSGDWRKKNEEPKINFFEDVASFADYRMLDGLLERLQEKFITPTLDQFQNFRGLTSSFCEGFEAQLDSSSKSAFQTERRELHSGDDVKGWIADTVSYYKLEEACQTTWFSWIAETTPPSTPRAQSDS